MKKQKVIDLISISLEDILIQSPYDAEQLLRSLLFEHLTENQALNAIEYLKSSINPDFNDENIVDPFDEDIDDENIELFDYRDLY